MGVYTTASLHGINENALGNAGYVGESVHEPGLKGAMGIIVENEQNYNEMMKAVGLDELRYFEENGTEVIYEGGRAKAFFTKLREFFKKVYQKIKDLFMKFMGMLDKVIKNDKDFVKKYTKLLLNTKTSGFEFKGFRFTLDATNVNAVEKRIDAYMKRQKLTRESAMPQTTPAKIATQQKAVEDWRAGRVDHQNAMRGYVTSAGKSVTEAELTKTLFKVFRDGEDTKEVLDNVSISKQLEIIGGYKEAKKVAKKNFNELEKSINNVLKDLKTQENKLSNPGDKLMEDANATAVRYISELYSATKDKLNVLQKVNGAAMSAMRQERAQAKAICTRLVTYRPKNESANYGRSTALSNVKFR